MHQTNLGHPDLMVPEESVMPKIRTKSKKAVVRKWKADVLEEANKKLNAEVETMVAIIEELRNKIALEEGLRKDTEKDNERLRGVEKHLRGELARAHTSADELRAYGDKNKKTAIIFAMLHVGSEDKISMRDRIEIIDALRDTAGYSAEEVGMVPVEVLCRAFTFITPTLFKTFEEHKKLLAGKKPKDIRITPEDVERLREILLQEMRASGTAK